MHIPDLLHRLAGLFNRRERWQVAGLMLMLLGGALLEVGGIGLIIPYIHLMAEPSVALDHERYGGWLKAAGIATPQQVIIWASSAMLALFIFKGAYLMASNWITYAFIYRRFVLVSRELLAAYLRAPLLFHMRRNTATLVRNATVETEYISGIMKYLVQLPTEIVVVVGVVGLLIYTHSVLALGAGGFIALVCGGLYILTARMVDRCGQARSTHQARMIQCVNQSLGGLKEVRVLGREGYFVDELERSGQAYAEAQRKSTFLSQYPRIAVEMLAGILLVALIFVFLLQGGGFQAVVPVLMMFGVGLVRLIPSATRIVTSVNVVRYYAPAVMNVLDDLHALRTVPAETTKPPGPVVLRRELRLENVGFQYPDHPTPAVQDVSLDIVCGQKVAFIGASGAGKTTLINMILGLLRPTTGRIFADGLDIGINLRGWQRDIGYIPQEIFLTDETIRRNVAFGLPDAEVEVTAVWRALEEAQLATFVRGLPLGLDTPVGERGVRLSAGQRQRIGIARALYHNPDLLVLDEATSALDNETERMFSDALQRLPRSKTVILIAHRLSTVRHCDRIFLMHEGRLTASGTYRDLATNNPLFQRLEAAALAPNI